jgi:transposase
VAAVSRPQVIDGKQHERVHDRVAAIDVAKDSGVVCTRTPHPSRPGARRSTIWTVQARTAAVRALGRQLVKDGIEIVTLESTSDYWRIWVRHEVAHIASELADWRAGLCGLAA